MFLKARLWDSAKAAVAACNETVLETLPDMNNNAIYAEQFKKYKAVHDALAPIYHGEY